MTIEYIYVIMKMAKSKSIFLLVLHKIRCFFVTDNELRQSSKNHGKKVRNKRRKMKKEYEKAELRVILFDVCDVVTSSDPDPNDTDWGGGQDIIW